MSQRIYSSLSFFFSAASDEISPREFENNELLEGKRRGRFRVVDVDKKPCFSESEKLFRAFSRATDGASFFNGALPDDWKGRGALSVPGGQRQTSSWPFLLPLSYFFFPNAFFIQFLPIWNIPCCVKDISKYLNYYVDCLWMFQYICI